MGTNFKVFYKNTLNKINPIVKEKPGLVWEAITSTLMSSRSKKPTIVARMLGGANGREGFTPSKSLTWAKLGKATPSRTTRSMTKAKSKGGKWPNCYVQIGKLPKITQKPPKKNKCAPCIVVISPLIKKSWKPNP